MARSAGTKRRGRLRDNPLVGLLGNPPTLSRGVERIVYQHAADGQRYGHDFGPDVRAQLNRDGSVTLSHRQGKQLWQRFGEKPFLVNPPPPRAKRSSRRAPQRQATRRAKTEAASHKEVERMARKRGRKAARRRSSSGRRRRSTTMVVHRNAPVARRRGRIRRNPPGLAGLSPRNLLGFAGDAVKLGLGNLVGKTAGRVTADLVKVDKNTPAGMGVQVLTGFGLGILVDFLLGRGLGAAIAGGAISSVGEQYLKGANIPYVSTGLGEWAPSAFPSAFAAYPRRQALPAAVAALPGRGDLRAYPRFNGVPTRNQPWAVYSQQ